MSRPVRRPSVRLAALAVALLLPATAAADAPLFPTAVPMPGPGAITAPYAPPLLVASPSADAVELDWKILGGLDYVNGKVPANLKALDGKLVKIPGFIVPLEDYEEEGAEFLLVPYFGACVHTPPPPPNQMVYVRMQGGKKLKFGWWDPVWMEGTLRIENYDSPYGAVGYQLVGMKTSPYAPK